jgi:hypothetical protein
MATMPLVAMGALARIMPVDHGGLEDELPACVMRDAEGLLFSMHTRCTKVAQETSDDN